LRSRKEEKKKYQEGEFKIQGNFFSTELANSRKNISEKERQAEILATSSR
jgi:hypothetical protein